MKLHTNKHKKVHIIFVLIGIVWLLYAFFMQYHRAPLISNARVYKEVIDLKLEPKIEGNEYVYTYTLPRDINEGDAIVYYTGHKELEAYIDGKKVYSLKSADGYTSTGYVWNYITIKTEDSGKNIEFRVRNLSGAGTPLDEFMLGPEALVTNRLLIMTTYMFVVGVLITLIGICILSIWIISNLRTKESMGNSMSYFSAFAIYLGLWTMSESRFIELVTPWNLLLVFIDHGALMMMPLSFVLYTKEVYTACKEKIWKIFCYGTIGIILARIALQFTGIMNLRDTLWMTHMSILIMGALGLYMVWCEYRTGRLKRNMHANSVCIVLLLSAAAIELILYLSHVENMAFGSTAFLIYVIVNAIGNLQNANEILRRANENEIYRKLAITDVLTGIGNRVGFQQEFNVRTTYSEGNTAIVEPTTIFMMDLNNLKICNDDFGHDYGDWYIIAASSAISEAFFSKGNTYRIGGDEFAAITSLTEPEEIEKLRQEVMEKFAKNICKDKRCPLNIAVGIATFDPNSDKLLSDTLKRADALMYENKMQIKGQNKNE